MSSSLKSLTPRELNQLVGHVFVENEAKDVILVFVGLDFGSHLVGRSQILAASCCLFTVRSFSACDLVTLQLDSGCLCLELLDCTAVWSMLT